MEIDVWEKDIAEIPGLGAARLRVLRKAGLLTVGEVLSVYPVEYYLRGKKPSRTPGETVAVQGSLTAAPSVYRARKGLTLLQARLTADGDSLACIWFNQPWVKRQLVPGKPYVFLGELRSQYGGLQLVNPTFEELPEEMPECVALYRPPRGVGTATLRQAVQHALEWIRGKLPDAIPEKVRERYRLMSREEALRALHLPKAPEEARSAGERMALEEALLFFVMASAGRRARMTQKAPILCDEGEMGELEALLPYRLTSAQKKTLGEILRDMASGMPMNRMVQGDVGSGKTVVALSALLVCARRGYQGVYMAPTEILAEQIYREAGEMLGPLGITVGCLTGSVTASIRQAARHAIAAGVWQVVVGTHALIQKELSYAKVGLVVTDEQHRFGVRQRGELTQKGVHPHTLVMSATPVPRSLSLALYGDLDLSVMDEMPPGRKPVTTRLVPQHRREDMYRYVAEQAKKGAQAYVVCPAIEDAPEGYALQSATSVYRELIHGPLKDTPTALIHGKVSASERLETLRRFREGEIKVLVSTTVVEVGLHVPQASIMIVEDAERFGLAQLHQLRGRVGRGGQEAYCFLLSSDAEDNPRLQIMARCSDGFTVAEEDLKLRGPGEVLGTRQSGVMDSRVLRLMKDPGLLSRAGGMAQEILSGEKEAADVMIRAAESRLNRSMNDIAMN